MPGTELSILQVLSHFKSSRDGYCLNFCLQMKMLWLSEVRMPLKVTQPVSGTARVTGFSSHALNDGLILPHLPILLEHLL